MDHDIYMTIVTVIRTYLNRYNAYKNRDYIKKIDKEYGS